VLPVTGLQLVIVLAAVVAVATEIASVLTGDSSWVDRIWSIVPVVHLWLFAGSADWDARVVLVAVLVTLWGARLTFNFARKGGYRGVEDYRWPILRSRMRPWQYQLFQIGFINGYQNVLLVLITLPAVTMTDHPRPLGVADVLLAIAFLAFLVGETAADQQQWDFHQRKAAAARDGRVLSPGFVTTGLWRWSRHPNFFGEQGQWWVVFGFGAVAAGSPWQWTAVGAVLLTLLFVGSTVFTESITASKYPEYAEYRRRTSMIVPWPRRRARGAVPPRTGCPAERAP
jgi:steroid 5-alpha reductase family enzyme